MDNEIGQESVVRHVVTKLTTEYDYLEDRLRLTVQTGDGVATVLWLTRRLAERLLPPVIARVTPHVDDTVALQANGPHAAKEAAQVYEQLQARLMHKPVAPVRPDNQSAAVLVSEIQLTAVRDGRLVLTFSSQGVDRWVQTMSQGELRQWLQMLAGLFQRAEWQSDFWPEWLRRHTGR